MQVVLHVAQPNVVTIDGKPYIFNVVGIDENRCPRNKMCFRAGSADVHLEVDATNRIYQFTLQTYESIMTGATHATLGNTLRVALISVSRPEDGPYVIHLDVRPLYLVPDLFESFAGTL
jgi:hypothetical protein